MGTATGVYHLNGPLYDHGINLNGKLLQLGADKELPPMEPVAPNGPLVLAPLDIAFVTLKTEGKACQQLQTISSLRMLLKHECSPEAVVLDALPQRIDDLLRLLRSHTWVNGLAVNTFYIKCLNMVSTCY